VLGESSPGQSRAANRWSYRFLRGPPKRFCGGHNQKNGCGCAVLSWDVCSGVDRVVRALFVPVRACSGNALRQRFVLRELQAEWGNLTRKGYPIAGWQVLGTAIECAIELPLWDSRD
jgi:hypothetical protein